MDKTELQQKIGEFYGRLPSDLQVVFSGMEWMEKVKNIGVKNFLNDRQKEILATETTLVLLSIINTFDYENNLSNELGLPGEAYQKLIKDLNESIVDPIREKLKNAFTENVKNIMESKYGDGNRIDKDFSSLPENLQESIDNSNYQLELYNISAKYSLGLKDIESLEEIVTNVMLGKIRVDKYEEEIRSKLGNVDSSKLNPMIYDIGERIFKNIKGELSKINVLNTINSATITKKEDEDTVPKPPYAQMFTNNYDLRAEKANNVRSSILVSKPAPKNEEEIYTKSGIEIMEHHDEPKNNTPKIDPYRENF